MVCTHLSLYGRDCPFWISYGLTFSHLTHNAVTIARMHRMFGVTMIEKGVSRLVSVDLGGAEELLAAE